MIESPRPQAPSRRRFWLRFVLAGPVVFIAAALLMCGAALYLPKGPAQIDNLVAPVVFFPAIWAALFFYAMLDRRLGRAYAVVAALSLAHAGLLALHLMK